MALTSLLVDRAARGEDRRVMACMPLRGAHVADAAMRVLNVVPTREPGRPAARCVEIVEAALGAALLPWSIDVSKP